MEKRTGYAEAQSGVTSLQGDLIGDPFGFGVAVHLGVQTEQRRHFFDHTIRGRVDRLLFGGRRSVEFFHNNNNNNIAARRSDIRVEIFGGRWHTIPPTEQLTSAGTLFLEITPCFYTHREHGRRLPPVYIVNTIL